MNARLAANVLRERRHAPRPSTFLADLVALALIVVAIAGVGVAVAVVVAPVVTP